MIWGLPIEFRFWLRVWPRGDCWEWRGSRNRKQYGRCHVDHESRLAHRLAFGFAKGFLSPSEHLDHLCNHPWCVKPSHLVVATNRENTLRSNGVCARHARQTHCVQGHPLSGLNLSRSPSGVRVCLECQRRRSREARQRQRVAFPILSPIRLERLKEASRLGSAALAAMPYEQRHAIAQKGGLALAAKFTPQERSERARRAWVTRRLNAGSRS